MGGGVFLGEPVILESRKLLFSPNLLRTTVCNVRVQESSGEVRKDHLEIEASLGFMRSSSVTCLPAFT